jgi:hypothetical protein
VNVDDALDELYGAPLDEFVAERARLAKKIGGDEGKALAKVRKPNVAAWTLNQLARRERRDVDLLLDSGHRLRQAQAGVLRGAEKETFEDARRKELEALRRLTKAAERLLRDQRGGATAAVLQQVGDGLRAAAITEEGRELLARGRFTEPPQASGFAAYAGIDVPKRAARKPKPRPKSAPKADPRAREIRELERKLQAAQAEVESLERRLRELRE